MNLGNVGRNVGFVALTAMSGCNVKESPSLGHACDGYVIPTVKKALKQANCSEKNTPDCGRIANDARIKALYACGDGR